MELVSISLTTSSSLKNKIAAFSLIKGYRINRNRIYPNEGSGN